MKRLTLLFLLCTPLTLFAQWGASYQYSALPFFGVSYEFKERWRPEIRLGTDLFFADQSYELAVAYDILNKPDYELYVGAGARHDTEYETSIVVPIGLNVYPFDARQFGFQMEVTPFFGESNLLRGSLGIRYQFRKKGD